MPVFTQVMVFVALIFSIVLPVTAVIVWKVKSKSKALPFIVGAVTFTVFSQVLEAIVHNFCIVQDNSVSRFILGNMFVFALYGGFMAGIFEEVGRFVAFKTVLKKYTDKKNAIAYGIGHGGIEVILLVTLTYVVYAVAIFNHSAPGMDIVYQTLLEIEPQFMFAAMLERVSAMMLHVGLSCFVFKAAYEKKNLRYLFLAILLHAVVDAPAIIYRYGYVNLWVYEVIVLIYAIVLLYLGVRTLKKTQVEAK